MFTFSLVNTTHRHRYQCAIAYINTIPIKKEESHLFPIDICILNYRDMISQSDNIIFVIKCFLVFQKFKYFT